MNIFKNSINPDSMACCIGFIFIFVLSSISLANTSGSSLKDNPDEPWQIDADTINYDEKTDQYFAEGKVVISKTGRKLTADKVRFDHRNMIAYAAGHVTMSSGKNRLTGNSMEMNLKTETGTLTSGSIFLTDNNFHITGDKIEKTGEESYRIDTASITTCDGDAPAWKITGKDLKVTIEGCGTVKHATLWAKKVPVLYTPFFFFPAQSKRNSGLLTPAIGSSDRKGMEYTQPFFWAINENSDATFYNQYMSKRGNKFGLEYRYALSDTSRGTFMYNFLDDKKIDDGKNNSSDDWGYDDDGEDILRKNSDRYWFRGKLDQEMPFGFLGKLDLDIVSDQDYLHEFEDGYTGFNKTERYFNRNFSRELDDYDDPVRVNKLNLNKRWARYNLDTEFLWYDDVVVRRSHETDTTLQRLPFVGFDASKQQISDSPFYWNLDSQYSYFYSEDGTNGHRGDVHPRLYLPYRYKNLFSFEPSAGVRETYWNIGKFVDNNTEKYKNNQQFRELYDIKLDLSTELYNTFQINGETIEKIQHTIRPQIVYDYIPDKSQEKYPDLDYIDRIKRKNLLTYSITNTFTSKSKILRKIINNQEDSLPQEYTYSQFCRFKLEQSFDIDEEREDDSARWANGENRRPFSPIYAELEFNPDKYLSIQADSELSPYDGAFESFNIDTNISDIRGDSLFCEYRYSQDYSESFYINFYINLSDRFSVYLENEQNLKDQEDIKSGLGFMYTSQCWAVHFGFTDDDGDLEYALMFDLYGLGGIGKSGIMGERGKNVFKRK
ncbi:MAG: LPS-assembly protein LptD [Deltaproteobacteria bacterium]|nr:LPS-assembly protein LptD [Deltaproteobacteria bacterium]